MSNNAPVLKVGSKRGKSKLELRAQSRQRTDVIGGGKHTSNQKSLASFSSLRSFHPADLLSQKMDCKKSMFQNS
jgi:hypothetical protein